MDQLITVRHAPAAPAAFSIHNLTVAVGYRVFNSNKYFIGDEEIPRANAIRNHQNIFDIGLEYRLSPRWSLIADVPVYDGTRNQLYPPSGIFQVSGVGDVTIGAQSWIFRPPSENGGNIAVNASAQNSLGHRRRHRLCSLQRKDRQSHRRPIPAARRRRLGIRPRRSGLQTPLAAAPTSTLRDSTSSIR